MRQILVDHARSRHYQKRDAGHKVGFDNAVAISDSKGAELIELDDALNRLAAIHKRKSDVVELLFFGGLSLDEIAEVLQVSRLTVIRDWNFGRAWLRSELKGKDPDGRALEESRKTLSRRA